VAKKLFYKTESDLENNTVKARVIKICPSVILLKYMLRAETDPRAALARISELHAVDKRIPERAGLVLFELLFEEGGAAARGFAAEVVALVRSAFPQSVDALTSLVAQNCKGRVTVASSQADLQNIFTNSSALGKEFSQDSSHSFHLFKIYNMNLRFLVYIVTA